MSKIIHNITFTTEVKNVCQCYILKERWNKVTHCIIHFYCSTLKQVKEWYLRSKTIPLARILLAAVKQGAQWKWHFKNGSQALPIDSFTYTCVSHARFVRNVDKRGRGRRRNIYQSRFTAPRVRAPYPFMCAATLWVCECDVTFIHS